MSKQNDIKYDTIVTMSEGIQFFAELLIYITLLVFTIYTIVLGYHFYSYGPSRHTSTLALIVFLSVSAVLFLGLIITYQYF
jgi:TRAP-type C4-dicarboxylate transport system permease small subunit